MFFAKNDEGVDLQLYISLLRDMISHERLTYQTLFEQIISSAQEIAKSRDEVSRYRVNQDIYDVVSLLVSADESYFRTITSIDSNVYSRVLGIMEDISNEQQLSYA